MSIFITNNPHYHINTYSRDKKDKIILCQYIYNKSS